MPWNIGVWLPDTALSYRNTNFPSNSQIIKHWDLEGNLIYAHCKLIWSKSISIATFHSPAHSRLVGVWHWISSSCNILMRLGILFWFIPKTTALPPTICMVCWSVNVSPLCVLLQVWLVSKSFVTQTAGTKLLQDDDPAAGKEEFTRECSEMGPRP